jgi:hypothetical protein
MLIARKTATDTEDEAGPGARDRLFVAGRGPPNGDFHLEPAA